LPDSVYIGGNLEPTDTSRSTVLIEDRGGGVMISTEEAASAARIEPRLRDRRDAVKRARIRKRVKWGILASVLVLLVVAALAVLGSGLFAIEEVRVEGAARTDPEALAQVIADLEGTPVLRADTGAAERELEQLPWVEDARVTTDFPDAATIELRERTPSAAFQGDDGAWRLVDDQGRVLEVGDEQPAGYLAVRGSGFPDVEPGQYGPPGLAGAATLARSLTPTVLARTAEITVTPDGSDLRLHFTDGAEVRFGAADELVQKLVRLETKLHDLGGDRVNYIDVSTNEVGQG
jgi:cell division protein FtsQ